APIGIPSYIEPWDPWADETERSVVEALNTALDLGFNYVDTAPGYGDGRAEELIGKALAARRSEFHLATKTPAPRGGWQAITADHVISAAEASLRRLQTDVIDVLQFHGGIWSQRDAAAVIDGPAYAAYQTLQEAGKVRFLGVTGEDPEALRPFIESDRFDVVQLRYNVIHQAAWYSILPLCAQKGLGVVVMRPLSSGIFQKLMRQADPAIDERLDLSALALNYVLSDARISTAIVGMRRAAEVRANNRISDDDGRRLDLEWLHARQV
ncbi:MAG TPA: aldo/keto reductase, partial [Limnochordia bacterium]|nr:aldo/keto reductase [Limnochordia bacterium]